MEAIRNSLRRLGQLGYFEPIIPDFLVTDDPLVVDIHLPVTDSKTVRAAFGAGYSSRDGLVGYIEVDDTNFLGRGQQARLKWKLADGSTCTISALPSPIFSAPPRPPGLISITAGGSSSAASTPAEQWRRSDVWWPLGQLTRGFRACGWRTPAGEPVRGERL